MALASATKQASFDQSDGEFLDMSDVLAFIAQRQNNLFARLGVGGTATETTHKWMEDTLNSSISISEASADGILTASGADTSLTVASGEGLKFKAGTIFKDTAAGKTEVMQVTAVATDVLTIVRDHGSTSVETHGTGTTAFNIKIIGHAGQEGQDAPDDESLARSQKSNYTQIFHKGVFVSDTLRKVLQAGVTDEFNYQMMNRMKEIIRELDNSIINGITSSSVGSDTVYRYMAGIIEFVSAATGNTNTDTAALTPTVLNALIEDIYDDGGEPNFILVGGNQKRAISAFDAAYRRSDYDAKSAGFTVDKFVSDLGYNLDIIVDPNVPADVAIVGDLNKLKVCSLLPMRAEQLARTGIGWKGQISGEYTLEVRNALTAFAYHNNLTAI